MSGILTGIYSDVSCVLGKGKKWWGILRLLNQIAYITYQVVTVRESEQGTARINMTWSWAASDLVRLLCCHWLAAAHRVLLLMLVTLVLILLQPTASTEWLLGFQWNCSEENIRLKNYCVGLLCSNLDLISSNVFTIFFYIIAVLRSWEFSMKNYNLGLVC